MKKNKSHAFQIFFTLIIFCVTIISCTKDKPDSCVPEKIQTGIIGNVQYGQGDCMPSVDVQPIRVYLPYSGRMYFIERSELFNLGNGDWEQLKQNSVSVLIRDGKLSVELAPNTYFLMPEDVYSIANEVTIESGKVLTRDFQFWKCTSF